jgi:uncharacterized membrane protein YeaQ/YmgE (transglycosylase-associated protein family)
MYFLSWIIIGLIAGWSAEKILKGNRYGPLMDIVIGIGGAVGGRIPHALSRLFRLSGNDLHNANHNNWCRNSDAACGFGRQEALRAATLTSCRHGEFKCQPTKHPEPSSSERTRFCRQAWRSRVKFSCLAGELSRISMGADSAKKSRKRSGTSSIWPARSGQSPLVVRG